MADLITSAIQQVVTKATDSRNLEQQLIQTFGKDYYKKYQEELKALKEQQTKQQSGGTYNKTVTTVETTAKNTSTALDNQLETSISNIVKNDKNIQKSINTATDKVISQAVNSVCSQIDVARKTAEEYYLAVQAAIRALRTTINNNPQLESDIKKTVEDVMTRAALDKESQLLGPVVNQAGSVIDSVANTGRTNVTSINNIVNSFNINKIIQNHALSSLNSISDSITNSTLGQLSNLPIVGSYFQKMQQTLNATIKTQGTLWINTEMTKISKYTKSITTLQETTTKYQKEINNEITKAQNEARQYVAKFEQQVINEIKKFIKLDNISIGGFKL